MRKSQKEKYADRHNEAKITFNTGCALALATVMAICVGAPIFFPVAPALFIAVGGIASGISVLTICMGALGKKHYEKKLDNCEVDVSSKEEMFENGENESANPFVVKEGDNGKQKGTRKGKKRKRAEEMSRGK